MKQSDRRQRDTDRLNFAERVGGLPKVGSGGFFTPQPCTEFSVSGVRAGRGWVRHRATHRELPLKLLRKRCRTTGMLRGYRLRSPASVYRPENTNDRISGFTFSPRSLHFSSPRFSRLFRFPGMLRPSHRGSKLAPNKYDEPSRR